MEIKVGDQVQVTTVIGLLTGKVVKLENSRCKVYSVVLNSGGYIRCDANKIKLLNEQK